MSRPRGSQQTRPVRSGLVWSSTTKRSVVSCHGTFPFMLPRGGEQGPSLFLSFGVAEPASPYWSITVSTTHDPDPGPGYDLLPLNPGHPPPPTPFCLGSPTFWSLPPQRRGRQKRGARTRLAGSFLFSASASFQRHPLRGLGLGLGLGSVSDLFWELLVWRSCSKGQRPDTLELCWQGRNPVAKYERCCWPGLAWHVS